MADTTTIPTTFTVTGELNAADHLVIKATATREGDTIRARKSTARSYPYVVVQLSWWAVRKATKAEQAAQGLKPWQTVPGNTVNVDVLKGTRDVNVAVKRYDRAREVVRDGRFAVVILKRTAGGYRVWRNTANVELANG